MAHLRAVSAEDAAPVDAYLLAQAEEIVTRIKAGEVIGLFAVIECGQTSREPVLAGELDVDGIAGYAARVLAAVADGEV